MPAMTWKTGRERDSRGLAPHAFSIRDPRSVSRADGSEASDEHEPFHFPLTRSRFALRARQPRNVRRVDGEYRPGAGVVRQELQIARGDERQLAAAQPAGSTRAIQSRAGLEAARHRARARHFAAD